MNCCRSMVRASERKRLQEGVPRSGDDQALWDAYVEELLKAKAKCDKLWKQKTDEERRTSLLTEPGVAMAGSSFENRDGFGFGEVTSICKERWRRRLQTRLSRAFQGLAGEASAATVDLVHSL